MRVRLYLSSGAKTSKVDFADGRRAVSKVRFFELVFPPTSTSLTVVVRPAKSAFFSWFFLQRHKHRDGSKSHHRSRVCRVFLVGSPSNVTNTGTAPEATKVPSLSRFLSWFSFQRHKPGKVPETTKVPGLPRFLVSFLLTDSNGPQNGTASKRRGNIVDLADWIKNHSSVDREIIKRSSLSLIDH